MADLKIKIKGDANSLNQALSRSQSKIANFKASVASISAGPIGMALGALSATFASIGAAAVAAYRYTARLADNLDGIAKASKRVGITTDEFQELSFIAKRTGADVGVIETSMRRMMKVIVDAGTGLERQKAVLAGLGLQYSDLEGKLPIEQFKIIAERLALVKDRTKQAYIAQEIFGRQGLAISEIAKNVKELSAEYKELNINISSDAIKDAEDYADAINDLSLAFKSLSASTGAISKLATGVRNLEVALTSLKDNPMSNLIGIAGGVLATGNAGAALSVIQQGAQSEMAGRAAGKMIRGLQEALAGAGKKAFGGKTLGDEVNEAANAMVTNAGKKMDYGIGKEMLRSEVLGGGGTLASLGGDISGGGLIARGALDQKKVDLLQQISEHSKSTQDALLRMTDDGRTFAMRTVVNKSIRD